LVRGRPHVRARRFRGTLPSSTQLAGAHRAASSRGVASARAVRAPARRAAAGRRRVGGGGVRPRAGGARPGGGGGHSGCRVARRGAPPAAVAAIVARPPLLGMRGGRAAWEAPAVAIVGSRAGSEYACAVAGRLASDLASRGVAIVSGLARGVDSAAHAGALAV